MPNTGSPSWYSPFFLHRIRPCTKSTGPHDLRVKQNEKTRKKERKKLIHEYIKSMASVVCVCVSRHV